MAARRERERRRPSGERQYRFAAPEPELETDDTLVEQGGNGTRPAAAAAPAPIKSTRTTITRPFSAYKDEYAYVYGDLRRVGVVIGSLLVVLIVLYFVLPLLVR